MHDSIFFLLHEGSDEPLRSFALSAEASEWLFSEYFWEGINESHGTFFGHYEEECVSSKLAIFVAKALMSKIESMRLLSGGAIRFRYGWNEQKEELFCSVESGQLKTELNQLADFFAVAEESKMVVCCQL